MPLKFVVEIKVVWHGNPVFENGLTMLRNHV